MRHRADPDAMRSEIATNEHTHRLIQVATTAHARASVLSGRDTLDPFQTEMSAVDILDFCRSTTSDKAHNSNDHYGSIGELRPGADDGSFNGGSSTTRISHPLHAETQETVVTAVDTDSKVNLGHLSAYPQPAAGLIILQQVKRPAIRTVKSPDEWIEMEITVDSGACVTVMPRSLCDGISILQNRLSREVVEYEVANGAHIPNFGKGRCDIMALGSRSCKRIVFQVADVHKSLLSISGCADIGFDCNLGDKGGYLLDKALQ